MLNFLLLNKHLIYYTDPKTHCINLQQESNGIPLNWHFLAQY